jgi:hypothetical protein
MSKGSAKHFYVMNKIRQIPWLIIFCAVFFVFVSCKRKNDLYFFNGEVVIVGGIEKPTLLTGEQVVLNDVYTGVMNVYDSLILFTSEKYPDKFVSIFSLNTGDLLGNYCPKGQGPDDYLSMINTSQFETTGTDIKLWIDAENNNKQVLFNITSSIRDNCTNIDSVIPFGVRNDDYAFCFVLNNAIAAKQSSQADKTENYLEYAIFDISNLMKTKTLSLYHSPITALRENLHTPYYLSSADRVKPDKTKIAMGMWMLNQLNILDLESGIMKGYRISGSLDFGDMNNATKRIKYCNRCIAVDDEYIYTLYVGVDLNEDGISHFFTPASQINVFDWKGNYVSKIKLDHEAQFIEFDPVKKFLYTIDVDETIYKYNLTYLYLSSLVFSSPRPSSFVQR